MIKRLVTLLGIISLSFFTACGGDDKTPAPLQAALKDKYNQEDLVALQLKADQMKQTCNSGLGGSSLLLATSLMGNGGGNNGGGINSILPLLLSQSTQGREQCGDSILQYMLTLNTTRGKNGQMLSNTPEGQAYNRSQFAALGNLLYGGIIGGFQQQGMPLTQAQATLLQTKIFSVAPILTQALVSNSGSRAPQLGALAGMFGM